MAFCFLALVLAGSSWAAIVQAPYKSRALQCGKHVEPGDGFELQLLDPATGALCLDGSPGGFYFRKGRGADASKFIVETEGGGFCGFAEDCWNRSQTDLGSSKGWPASGCPTMDGGSNGMLSRDCSTNPFCNYTMVHLNYCDGASFSGFVTDPVPIPGKGHVFYRGRAILDASIAQLMTIGLSSASEIIWKGCSAGGLSVFLQADYVHSKMPSTARFVAVPDAGFLLDEPSWTGVPVGTPQLQAVFANQNATYNLNAACLQHYTPTNDTWRCIMAPYVLPFITSDYYITQDLDDSIQLGLIGLVSNDCLMVPFGRECTPPMIAYVHQYRYKMLAALQPLFSTVPRNGGFLTTCLNHCHQNIEANWMRELVSGRSLVKSFHSWYTGGSLQPLVIDDQLGLNPTCQISACAHAA